MAPTRCNGERHRPFWRTGGDGNTTQPPLNIEGRSRIAIPFTFRHVSATLLRGYNTWRMPSPQSRFFHPLSEMVNVIKKTFQRVWGQTSLRAQPIRCKFCGNRVRDASYASNGSVINGPKSKMAHFPESGVTVIWHKSCHRPDQAGSNRSVLVRLIMVARWNWRGVPCCSD